MVCDKRKHGWDDAEFTVEGEDAVQQLTHVSMCVCAAMTEIIVERESKDSVLQHRTYVDVKPNSRQRMLDRSNAIHEQKKGRSVL